MSGGTAQTLGDHRRYMRHASQLATSSDALSVAYRALKASGVLSRALASLPLDEQCQVTYRATPEQETRWFDSVAAQTPEHPACAAWLAARGVTSDD